MAFLLTLCSDALQHWFVFPVICCGGLVSAEFIDWLRGRRDLFDPGVVLSAAGVHMFYFAPLAHVLLDQYMQYITPPEDWRPWLGWMAFMNVIGIAAWRLGAWTITRRRDRPRPRSRWIWARGRIHIVLAAFLLISLALQVYVYVRFGGLSGYISVFGGVATGAEPAGFSGMGWLFAISESLPYVSVIALFSLFSGRRLGWLTIAGLFLGLIALKLLFGGMRGSRSETVWFAFWFLGVVHYTVRKITRPAAAVALILMLGFMYVYSFYKAMGPSGLALLGHAESRSELAQDIGRSFSRVMLGDLARADVQAFLLYQYQVFGADFQPARGRTYVGAITAYVPSALGIPRVDSKTREGTELQFGPGSYDPPTFQSTVIYGLAGETLLNFGPLAIPVAFFAFGMAAAVVTKALRRLPAGDSRWFLAPFCHYGLVLLLTHDIDNVLYVPTKVALVPLMAVFLSSVVTRTARLPVAPARPFARIVVPSARSEPALERL